jgi:diguanylate cyclase (GGDEF)-like protein
MGSGSARTRLPVPYSYYGPFNDLQARVHGLADDQRIPEAFALADVCEAAARGFGDEKTLGFVIQARMYCYLHLGQFDVAAALAETLLARHRASGNVLDEAKTLSNLANLSVRRGRIAEGMRYLARAGLLLEKTTRRGDRYVSAYSSYALAAMASDLYEVAAAGYEKLEKALSPDLPSALAGVFWGEIQLQILMVWGLHLDQLGYSPEATSRLRRAAATADDWLRAAADDPDKQREVKALKALPMAKLGRLDEAIALAQPVILLLHEQGRTWAAWAGHLALGVAYRARGDLAGARRELVAARWLTELGSAYRGLERPIVQHELAMLSAQTIGSDACADLLDDIRMQAQQVWQQRLQRMAMLRQARKQEELEMERARTEAAMLFDPVTGLGNRRRFDQLMSAVDGGQLATPISMLILDIDKFTAIVDTHSLNAGDYVLREVGTILKANCRPADPLPIRYTGDQFVVFLHGDLPTAVAVAKRVREAVAAADFDHIIPGTPVTVSAGVAMLRPGMTAAELFRAADTNLFRAKRDGRDRVIG